jgi:hypothetical protein
MLTALSCQRASWLVIEYYILNEQVHVKQHDSYDY